MPRNGVWGRCSIVAAGCVQHALPARNNATDKRHRRASMASQIVLRCLDIVRQRLAHRNQVPHFPCFPAMELRVRGCIWQDVFKFQAGPLQYPMAQRYPMIGKASAITSCRSATKLDCDFYKQVRSAVEGYTSVQDHARDSHHRVLAWVALLCSPKCIFLSTWPGSPGLISRQLGRMRTTSKAS